MTTFFLSFLSLFVCVEGSELTAKGSDSLNSSIRFAELVTLITSLSDLSLIHTTRLPHQ